MDLISNHSMSIDWTKGCADPRYAELAYSPDYDFLDNTLAEDGARIAVWMDSLKIKTLTGILCMFDTLTQGRVNSGNRDAEMKLLIGCTKENVQVIREFYSDLAAFFISNLLVEHELSN